MPKVIGAATRTSPAGCVAVSCAASSAHCASARMRCACSASVLPLSVSVSLREVRWNRLVPRCASSRAIAFDTVALETPIASAAALNERCSTTQAKIAQASRSGRRIPLPPSCRAKCSRCLRLETIGFQRFYFHRDRAAYLRGQAILREIHDDRETFVRKPWPCRSRLAQRAPSFQLRQLLRSRPDGLGCDPRVE